MIVKMLKYTLVVLAREKDEFLARLQELGMVDVTSTGWEPTDAERAAMGLIERHKQAVEFLVALKDHGTPFETGTEAFDKYEAARAGLAHVDTETARYEKLLVEAAPLGEFDPEAIRTLARHGVDTTWLMEEAGIDTSAGEVRLPDESPAAMRAHVAALEGDRESWNRVLADAAASIPAIEAETERLTEQLQLSRTTRSGRREADDSLVVMEAWAREKQAEKVDAMLAAHPAVVYFKERPTPDDETPVELKNGGFASPFEFIGDLYAKPKYGTMDLTRWFAPFFMLFFGMCMGDFGYGTLIFLGGLALTLTTRQESMRAIGRLTMWCGGAAVVVGFIMGGAFGVSMAEWKIFEPIRHVFIDSNSMFYVAIGVGIFQVLFAMVLNIVTTARAFGIVHSLASIGWLIVLLTGIVSFGGQKLGLVGFEAADAASGAVAGVFAPWSTAFLACVGVGVSLMLLFDLPGKNPLLSVGSGLWTTFNRVTGLLGDALSYIRLFALGLAGGILAQVFNQIATQISPDIPVVGQIVTLIILLIGHSLNLFLSTLSAIVHPLRLTFVEFFNNAGFEASERVFDPLAKKTNK